MVLGVARRMGGCGDALAFPAAVFSPNLFPLLLLPLLLLCTFLYHVSNCAPLRDSP